MEKIPSAIALVIAIAIGVGFPAVYFWLRYSSEITSIDVELEIHSAALSDVANANPIGWKFELSRLEYLLSQRPRNRSPETRTILDLAGKTVAESHDLLLRPKIERTTEIYDATGQVGTMVIGRSIQPLVLHTGFIALICACLGGFVFVSVKAAESKQLAQLERMNLLDQITIAIGERQDLQSIYQVAIRSLEQRMPVDFSCIFRFDADSHALTVIRVGIQSHPLAMSLAMEEESNIPIDQNGLSRCVAGHFVYEPDVRESAFPFPRRLARGGLRSLVIAPLMAESRVFGILVAARCQADAFSSGDCEFLRQLSAHVALAAQQAQVNEALRVAYDELRRSQQVVLQQERLSALGQMASGIAHDINNAISPVALYTETLLEREPGLSERTRSYLKIISRAIDDVAATVARMREFYRQREPQTSLLPMDLGQLAQQVADLTHARWSDMPQQRGISIALRMDLAHDLPPVLGLESEVREALINLIFNAVDAMPSGGTLTVRTRMARASQRVDLEVIDTGVGMDDETRRRCLEPFFTTKGERGTGLGLAMVYGFAQRHGITIEIDSVLKHGTTVRLGFPALSGHSPVAVVSAIPSVARMCVLIVDDDPLLLKSLRDALEADGHAVTAASGGRAGIDAFFAGLERAQPFDVVITDLGMADVDGRKVSAAIKGASPATPVIMLTGWGQRLMDDNDTPAHVDMMLSKPPKLQELRGALIRSAVLRGTNRG